MIFDLLAEPVDDLYYGLLDFALTECTVALLVQQIPELGEEGQKVLQQLSAFLRDAAVTDEWPGSKAVGWTATVLRYDYAPGCAEILKHATNRLYGWTQRALPEDLCLLRGDEDPWLVTITHEKDGYLRLSTEEKAGLVAALPRMGPLLGDERSREENRSLLAEVQGLLNAWDPEGWAHYEEDPESGYGPEARAIHYALASGEAGTEAELTRYIAAMLQRWWGERASVSPEGYAHLARTVWSWWRERQGK